MEFDELICTLCSLRFDDERIPHMIPQCGHTFCSKCLQGILDQTHNGGEFVCPEDNISMDLQSKDLSDFPKNFTLIRMLDKRKSLKESDRRDDSCSGSRGCVTQGDILLGESLIDIKDQSVPKVSCGSTTKESFSLESSFKDEENLCSGLEENYCFEHQRNYEVVCLDHRCRICTNCALFGSHKNHEIKQEEEIFREIALRAEKLIDIFQVLETEQKSFFEQGLEGKVTLKLKFKQNELSKIIHDKFNEFIEILRSKEKKLLNEIEQKFKKIENDWKEMNQIPSDFQGNLNNWKSKAQDLLVSVTEKSEKREIAFEMLEDKKNNREDLLINGQHLIGDLKKYSSISIKPLEDLISKAKVNFNDSFTLGLDMTYEVFMPSFEVPQVNIATIDPYNYDVFSLGKQFQQSFGPISQENKGQRLFMETARNERSTKNLLDINVDTTLSQPFEDLLAYAPSFGVSSTKTTTSSKKLFGNNGSIQEFGFREPILTERSTFFNNINHQDAKKSPMPKSLAIKTKALPVQDLENYSQIANSSIFIQDQNESLLTNPQYLPNEGKKNPTRLRNENMQLTFREAIGGSVSPPKGHDIIEQTMKARRKHSIKVSDRFEPIIDGIKKKTLENADLTGAGLGDSGMARLAEYLKDNHNLKSLKLVKNKITDEGGMMLVNALYYNRGIQVINLTQNLMTEKVVDAFVELLRAKKTIKTIYLNQNCLSTRNLKQKVKEMASLGVNLCV